MSWSGNLFTIIAGLGFIIKICKDFFEIWKLNRATKKGLFKISLNLVVFLVGLLFWIYLIVNSGGKLLFEDKFEQTDLSYLIVLGIFVLFIIALFVLSKLQSLPEKTAPKLLQDQNPDLQKDQKSE